MKNLKLGNSFFNIINCSLGNTELNSVVLKSSISKSLRDLLKDYVSLPLKNSLIFSFRTSLRENLNEK